MLIIVSSPAVPKLTAIDGTTRRIVSAATPGSEDVKGGYEDGSVVRVGGVTHLFVSELYHAPPPAGGYDDVHMRLGHWSTSGGGESAAGWKREGTLVLDGAPLYSTANCSSSSVGDHNASIWSPTATFDRHRQQWCVASVGYDCINEPAKHVKRPRSGAIRLMCSTVGGLGGVGGPFERVHVPGGFLAAFCSRWAMLRRAGRAFKASTHSGRTWRQTAPSLPCTARAPFTSLGTSGLWPARAARSVGRGRGCRTATRCRSTVATLRTQLCTALPARARAMLLPPLCY